MQPVLVLTHADETGATLTRASLEVVTAGQSLAQRLSAPIILGVVAADPAAANSISSTGARILAVTGPDFAQSRYASDAAALEALCRAAAPSVVLAPGSSRFARVAAGVAHRFGGQIDTHITALGGTASLEVTRWFYRQRIEARLHRDGSPWFLVLEPGTNAPYQATVAGTASVEPVTVTLPTLRTTVSGLRAASAGEQNIRPDAKLLFVAGAGWTKKQPDGQIHAAEAGQLILGFLAKTHASLGSSKSLVDQGSEGQPVLPFLTHMNQIGQTGSTPRHPKGLSTCCHGEEPHVVGWRFVNERRAISLDPNCGWTRGKADVVYIADAFKVIEKVNELLGADKP